MGIATHPTATEHDGFNTASNNTASNTIPGGASRAGEMPASLG